MRVARSVATIRQTAPAAARTTEVMPKSMLSSWPSISDVNSQIARPTSAPRNPPL
jgi:hypothetical protein